MGCTEFLKARVSPEIKLQTKAVADREFLSEAAWLKRLVLREIRACDAGRASEGESSRAEDVRRPGNAARGPNGCGRPMRSHPRRYCAAAAICPIPDTRQAATGLKGDSRPGAVAR